MLAYNNDFKLMMVLTFCAVPLVALLRRAKAVKTRDAGGMSNMTSKSRPWPLRCCARARRLRRRAGFQAPRSAGGQKYA